MINQSFLKQKYQKISLSMPFKITKKKQTVINKPSPHLPRKSSFCTPGKPGSQSHSSKSISWPNDASISAYLVRIQEFFFYLKKNYIFIFELFF